MGHLDGLEIMMVAEVGEVNSVKPPNPRLGEGLVLEPETLRGRIRRVDTWKYHPSETELLRCGVEPRLCDTLLEEKLDSRGSRPVSQQHRCRHRRRRRHRGS